MQIHLSKPNGQREGPFTLEQINRELAAKKYSDTDYWAWYEGLDAWVPLHTVPGISVLTDQPPEPLTLLEASPDVEQSSRGERPSSFVTPQTTEASQVSSGMSSEALEQIFVFTSGEGPAV